MATPSSTASIQIVNVDLAPERQTLLRDKLRELFKTLGRKAKQKRELIYTVNADGTDIDNVLRRNPAADVLFTGFAYDTQVSEAYKRDLSVDATLDLTSVDPGLRYPIIAEYRKHVAEGKFRHRKLFLVGDIYDRLCQVVRSDIPVRLSVYTNEQRSEASQPMPISSVNRLAPHSDKVPPPEGKIDVAQIHRLWIADIPFDGVVNMPEVGNRFVLGDSTVIDTIRQLFSMEGVREVMTREFLQEEQLTFVRSKRVFILLEPDLELILTERLTFDKMSALYQHHTLEEAKRTLETGKSRSLVEFFETQGYDILFEIFDQDERDRVLIAVLGDKLGEMLEREIATQKSALTLMDEGSLESLLYKVPEALMTRLVDGVKDREYEKFLALVPGKIRETVILAFLADPDYVAHAWQGIGETEKDEILTVQAAPLMAHLNLLNGNQFREKFPSIEFEFSQNYDSQGFAQMSKDEQRAAHSLFTKSMLKAHLPEGILQKRLSAAEISPLMSDYIRRYPAEFYNQLNPVVRKQLWITVGREYKDHISGNLHFLDKAAILKGNKEAAIEQLFADPEFLQLLKSGSEPELSANLFLTLKKGNKAETKHALLKKVLTDKAWGPRRKRGIPLMLSQPENQVLYRKLTEHVEGLEFTFGSLICTREHYELLKDAPPLRDAVVTLVDELVDPSLFNLFQRGDLSKEEYTQFSQSVEAEIGKLRAELSAKETEDPVGVYLLESMQTLQQMSNQAMRGELNPETVEQLDGRAAVRERLVLAMQGHIDRIDTFLEKADAQAGQIAARMPQVQAAAEKQGQIYDAALKKARTMMADMQKLQAIQTRATADRKKVAVKQKELSVQFFEIIEPLILEKVRALGSPMKALMKALGFQKEEQQTQARRVIFRFSDEEIQNILRYNIIFCTKDDILMQFIVTCLRIDNLQDSLFKMGTREALPHEGIDILFYGPEYDTEDFAGVVKENRMVAFADAAFLKSLQANEQLKARTKSILQKAEKEGAAKKQQLDVLGKDLKAKQTKSTQLTAMIEKLNQSRVNLERKAQHQRERRHHYATELDMLESRLCEVDAQFAGIKQQVTELAAGSPEGAMIQIDEGRQALAEKLQAELHAMNKQLARMVYIKGVKDSGERISKDTQNGMLARMHAAEVYRYSERPFKKLLVGDDGTNVGRNLKRVFINVGTRYFKMAEQQFEDVSLKRLEGRSENATSEEYPFVVLISDQPEDNYAAMRSAVRRIRANMPETYQLVLMPFGEVWKHDAESPDYQNLASIKEHSALVNAALGDLASPHSMLRMLYEKVPLN